HDRMPVVLPEDAESEWLTADPEAREELCRPYDHLVIHWKSVIYIGGVR
ncbi:MAG: SOS response-associated peptidase family protein, partial [Halobacteriaceae archaeon]